MTYKGSCHCGRIAFEVEAKLEGVMSCNCSICQRKAALMWFVPRDALRLLKPESNAAVYTFNRHVIQHRFCPVCGIHAYGDGTDPQGNRMAAINVRCLENVDIEALPVTKFDGRSL